MSKISQLVALAAAAGVLAGCATGVGTDAFIDFTPAPMSNAAFMPKDSALQFERIKVVVFDAEGNSNYLARDAELGSTLGKAIESNIGAAGAEIVDDALASKLRDVLRNTDLNARVTYAGPAVAKFAIRSVVTGASYGAAYVPASSYTDKKGRTNVTPATYSHVAEVSTDIRIYELPSLKLMRTIGAKGEATFSDPRTPSNATTARGLVQAAGQNAVEKASAELRKEFAATGYVVAKKSNSKIAIFNVTLGSQNGLKPGSRVHILALQPADSGLSRKADATEEVLVARGKVTEMVDRASAWIQLDDEVKADQIQRGLRVRPDYESKGWLKF
jgi:hypothetical protein